MKPGTLAPDPPRLGWRDAVATLRSEPTHTRILGGSIIMLLGSVLVSVFNFGYNVAVCSHAWTCSVRSRGGRGSRC